MNNKEMLQNLLIILTIAFIFFHSGKVSERAKYIEKIDKITEIQFDLNRKIHELEEYINMEQLIELAETFKKQKITSIKIFEESILLTQSINGVTVNKEYRLSLKEGEKEKEHNQKVINFFKESK